MWLIDLQQLSQIFYYSAYFPPNPPLIYLSHPLLLMLSSISCLFDAPQTMVYYVIIHVMKHWCFSKPIIYFSLLFNEQMRFTTSISGLSHTTFIGLLLLLHLFAKDLTNMVIIQWFIESLEFLIFEETIYSKHVILNFWYTLPIKELQVNLIIFSLKISK